MRKIRGLLRENVFGDGTVWRSFYCPGCGKGHTVTDLWEFDGNYEAPTFSPSVLTWGSPWENYRCHSFVRGGRIEFLSDCTHTLAGQTVDLPAWSDKEDA